ncbi:MAG TPA: hypothetical protein GXZ78_03090 [Eubacteriaceae bacterium]|jgi:hypothetical protein|nr:hypothetical protein [Eubacteriaceae bacterium]
MELGIGLLIIGAILVYGAKFLTKIIKIISFLAFKIIGFIIVLLGILFIFELI